MYKLKIHLHGTEVKIVGLESGSEYVFGRSSTCDIQLEEQPGISRSHFRIAEDNGQWNVRVISKFGRLLHLGQPIESLTLAPGFSFQIAGYSFLFIDDIEEQVSAEMARPLAAGDDESDDQGSVPSASERNLILARSQSSANTEFEGNDEATKIMAAQREVPYLRIIDKNGVEDTIKLDGRRWVAGRDESCDIFLNDKKASRRQIEIISTPQGYFIRDLGSSNGTLFNGIRLRSREQHALRSGDVCQVGSTVLHFEIRDPNFEKRLMVVPPEIRAEVPMLLQNPYEMINYPVPVGPGGALRIDGNGASWGSRKNLLALAWGENLPNEQAKRKRRLFVVATALVALLMTFIFMSEEKAPPKTKVVTSSNEAFSRLAPPQQQKVRETFALAKNLYMQKKLALAADQLTKLHAILPEGFENSLAMAEDCRETAELEERLRFVQDQQKKLAENRRVAEETIAKCESLSQTTLDSEALRSCLMPAIDREPEHPKLAELLGRVANRVEEHNLKIAQQRSFQESVKKGTSLFAKAEKLESEGFDLDAIEAYKKHINSAFPDPNRLKERSRQNMTSLIRRLASRVDESLRAAEDAFSQKNYRDAINQINKAKAIDPMNEKAAELNAVIRRELHKKLKDIYEDSIISEGIGNIEDAKRKWESIIQMDHPEGEYYKKSRNKLRGYGGI